MPDHYLSGGEQTTINAAMTELFPALAFNTGTKVTSAKDMREFIDNLDLTSAKAKKTFVNDSNIIKAEEYITMSESIRPSMRNTKLENAVGIKNWIDEYNKDREIEEVKWAFREKPSGVDSNHAADVFLVFKNKKINPKMLGISLKAGTAKSKEPKMNSYMASTLRKPQWEKAFPKALQELKDDLWEEVYSKVPALPKTITKSNYVVLSGTRQVPNKELQHKVLMLFKRNPQKFDELYEKMNLTCRKKLISMINDKTKGLNATKEWILNDFNLPLTDMDPPLVLVKAVGDKAEEQAPSVRNFLPAVTEVHAYLSKGSVQEWFIDLKGNNGKKMTLLMTIRSDSQYREQKQKGKLGAYLMLKLLYRGTK